MKKIYTSATKLTLLSLVASLIGLTFLGTVDTKIFEAVILMVVGYYFGQKQNTSVK